MIKIFLGLVLSFFLVSPVAAFTNLLIDGGFESWVSSTQATYWDPLMTGSNYYEQSTSSYQGDYALKTVALEEGWTAIMTNPPVDCIEGHHYRLSIKEKLVAENGLQYNIGLGVGAQGQYFWNFTSSTWEYFSDPFTQLDDDNIYWQNSVSNPDYVNIQWILEEANYPTCDSNLTMTPLIIHGGDASSTAQLLFDDAQFWDLDEGTTSTEESIGILATSTPGLVWFLEQYEFYLLVILGSILALGIIAILVHLTKLAFSWYHNLKL